MNRNEALECSGEREEIALLLLRIGLGFFLFVWGCDKFAEPGAAVRIFHVFYKIPIAAHAAYAMGGIEALLSILLIAGAWKEYTYGGGLALHAISTAASWRQLTSPFSRGHHLFVAAIPVLMALLALYLLRDRDTLWALDNIAVLRTRSMPRRYP
jgi:putative oxidoreductase